MNQIELQLPYQTPPETMRAKSIYKSAVFLITFLLLITMGVSASPPEPKKRGHPEILRLIDTEKSEVNAVENLKN